MLSVSLLFLSSLPQKPLLAIPNPSSPFQVNALFHIISFLFFFFTFGRTAWQTELPRPGIEPVPSALEAQGSNHWNTREAFPHHFRQNLTKDSGKLAWGSSLFTPGGVSGKITFPSRMNLHWVESFNAMLINSSCLFINLGIIHWLGEQKGHSRSFYEHKSQN